MSDYSNDEALAHITAATVEINAAFPCLDPGDPGDRFRELLGQAKSCLALAQAALSAAPERTDLGIDHSQHRQRRPSG